jgi:hypothetical protein
MATGGIDTPRMQLHSEITNFHRPRSKVKNSHRASGKKGELKMSNELFHNNRAGIEKKHEGRASQDATKTHGQRKNLAALKEAEADQRNVIDQTRTHNRADRAKAKESER